MAFVILSRTNRTVHHFQFVILNTSSTPRMTELFDDPECVFGTARYSIVFVPVLMGLVTLVGLFVAQLLALPEIFQFVLGISTSSDGISIVY